MDDEDMGGMHSVVCDTLFELQEEDMAMELNLPIVDPKKLMGSDGECRQENEYPKPELGPTMCHIHQKLPWHIRAFLNG
jgi:hypothetical protein